MKALLAILISAVLLLGCATTAGGNATKKELVVYSYDSFGSEYGLGKKIIPIFEKKCNCTVKLVAQGDVGWLVAKLISEKENPQADVVVGIDNSFKSKVLSEGVFEQYTPIDKAKLVELATEKDDYLTPFDYGFVAIEYDSERVAQAPNNFEEMAEPLYSKKIVMPDPRTSSTGRIFLFWVASEYGEATGDYLQRLKPNVLSVTPGWSDAYNLFTNGEADYVVSYSTSPAYHIEYENTTKYKAVMFPRMYKQVEYVGVVKGTENRKLSQQFVDFMISEEVQNEVPLGNIMYPARNGVKLPGSFRQLEYPGSISSEAEDEKWIKIWGDVFSG